MSQAGASRQETFSGTKEVTAAHAFDVKKLETYLADRIEGFQTPLEVRQFKGGQSNPTYQLVTPNRKYVMRRKPPGKLLPSAHAVDREFKVISALYPTGFPVAKPYVLCEDESITGTMFYVMDCVEGRVLWEGVLPGMDKKQRWATYDAMNETLARLHNLDHVKIGLEDFGKPTALCGAPDRALDQAVPDVGNRDDLRDEQADRLAAETSARRRQAVGRARRLPSRQHDPASDGAEGTGCDRLGTLNHRRSARATSPIT